MSWQVVALVIGVVWILPFMYIVKWVFMSRMYERASANRLAGLEDEPTYPTDEGDTPPLGIRAEGSDRLA